MCISCESRALKLKRLAFDFRRVAQMSAVDPDLLWQLERSAAELETIADGLCSCGQDVVWAEESGDGEVGPASSEASSGA
jgi:hypothetical protein